MGFFFLFIFPAGCMDWGMFWYHLQYLLQEDIIGHEAHLGGAVIGLTVAVIMHPSSLPDNYFPILAIAVLINFYLHDHYLPFFTDR